MLTLDTPASHAACHAVIDLAKLAAAAPGRILINQPIPPQQRAALDDCGAVSFSASDYCDLPGRYSVLLYTITGSRISSEIVSLTAVK